MKSNPYNIFTPTMWSVWSPILDDSEISKYYWLGNIEHLESQLKELRKQKRKEYHKDYYKKYYIETKRINMELSKLTDDQKIRLYEFVKKEYPWAVKTANIKRLAIKAIETGKITL